MIYAIYIITNILNGKQYVGFSKNLERRWKDHKRALGEKTLYDAIRKYGVENFVFTHLADTFNLEAAKQIEMLLIKEHNTLAPNGYNRTPGGDATAPELNGPKSAEWKKKIGDSNRGVSRGKGISKSKTHNENVSKALKGNKNSLGRKRTEETCAKMRAAWAIRKAKMTSKEMV
jgi:group I intron endonuclease